MTTAIIRLAFTADEIAGRRRFLGGSDANILMSGDAAAVVSLWNRKTGREPEADLSDVLAVQMGVWTEELNARWYTKQTGRAVSCRNEFRTCEKYYWMGLNMDGLTTAPSDLEPAYFEAKWMGAFGNPEERAQQYMPQLTHGMLVTGTERAVLSILTGKPTWELFEVGLDEFYAAELIERERAFWHCVERDEYPPEWAAIQPPAPIETFRSVDMTGNNLFADAAARWLGSRAAAQTFKGAEKDLKGLVEPDVCKATGYGVTVTRNKAGSLSIKEG